MDMFLEESEAAFRPQVLEVHLGGPEGDLSISKGVWSDPDPLLEGVGSFGGSALCLALHLAAARRSEPLEGLSLAVGCAVRRRLPTAARLALAGISPLTGLYADSQVGSDMAARLVQVTDGLVLRGCLPQSPGLCLVLDARGAARLERLPELERLPLPERCALLRRRFPAAGGLCVGPAAQHGIPFASLATLADPPSTTGRGGLGARLGGMGLVALLVDVELDSEPERQSVLSQALADSPHLQARGLGGTFELLDAFAARGDLPARPAAPFASSVASRQACPGCPTACRHILNSAQGRVAARFSALHPLGETLGLSRPQDQLALLAACNGQGVDASEVGASLRCLDSIRVAQGAKRLRGDVEALVAEVQNLRESPARAGSRALASSVEHAPALSNVRGSAVRRVSDLASLLGQCVSLRGNDPMRSFPFLTENGGDQERLARLVAPLELPAEAFDSQHPAGKGRLVWWHENLANIVDASGFCAFSAAGLIGDGFGDLDDLAKWLELPGLQPSGAALQAAGASLVLLQRELAERLGDAPGADLPDWFREDAGRAGMWDEYCQLRGLDARGRVLDWARGCMGQLALLDEGCSRLAALPGRAVVASPASEALERQPGQVELIASQPLAAALGAERLHSCDLPASVGSLMRLLAERHPSAAPWIWRAGDSAVCIYRQGRRLALHELVHDGDQLDLVVAISGG